MLSKNLLDFDQLDFKSQVGVLANTWQGLVTISLLGWNVEGSFTSDAHWLAAFTVDSAQHTRIPSGDNLTGAYTEAEWLATVNGR